MMDRQMIFILLMQFVASTTAGQSCFKRFVGGKMRSYGNCESKQQSIVTQVQSSAKEEQRVYCQGNKSLKMTHISVRFTNGSTVKRSASLNGRWTVIQRRQDGSVNFRRNWTEYVNGFGNPCWEYWLGLEAIHQLTKNGDHELRIDMIENGTGNKYYAEYSSFMLEDESHQYHLRVRGYTGNATDSLIYTGRKTGVGIADNNQFSTYDVDNDNAPESHCASKHSSGWWYRGCSVTNLNGQYGDPPRDGIFWLDSNRMKNMPLIFSEMRIRKADSTPPCPPASCDGVTLKEIEIPKRNGPAMKRNVSMDGNWTVIQRRVDGCVSFSKTWVEYRAGFGSPCGNFWLGLEAIHQLTKNGDHELRIDMIENGTGAHYYAEYSSFKVTDESHQYTLRAGGYSGNATDSLTDESVYWYSVANNQKFSTSDVDNDEAGSVHCASKHSSGWWYGGCSITNLNGRYGDIPHDGIFWHDNNRMRYIILIFSEMKIRIKN